MALTTEPKLMFGKVMHHRLFPKRNLFTYGVYYLAFHLSQIQHLPIAYNRFAPLSFHDQDHGKFDGSSLESWIRTILSDYAITEADGEIMLICMPRIFGYVFNPVSFWLCYDKQGGLRAVLCEVHNTFGERHSYLCAHDDHHVITGEDCLKAEKIFHVSPMLQREGHYQFQFDITQDKFGIWIDFFDRHGDKQLATALTGHFTLMTNKTLKKAFWGYPLISFKVILLIHWQALKLLTRGIKYITKPDQKSQRISATMQRVDANNEQK